MVWETGVLSLVESYQRLKKGYLIPPYLALSNKRYGSRVKWSNPGKGVVPSPAPRCSSYWKGRPRVTLDDSHLLYFTIYICVCVFVCVVSWVSHNTTSGRKLNFWSSRKCGVASFLQLLSGSLRPGVIWPSPFYGLNRYFRNLLILDRKTWNHITIYRNYNYN